MVAVAPRWPRCELRRHPRRPTVRAWPSPVRAQERMQAPVRSPRMDAPSAVVPPLRLMGTPSVRRSVAAVARDAHWVVAGARSGEQGARSGEQGVRSAAEALSAVRGEWRSPTAEMPTRAGVEARCPSRAWRAPATAPRDRPASRRARQRFPGRRSWEAAVSGGAATLLASHWLRVEDPTTRSRQSTDGWLLGRVVGAPRHSFRHLP